MLLERLVFCLLAAQRHQLKSALTACQVETRPVRPKLAPLCRLHQNVTAGDFE